MRFHFNASIFLAVPVLGAFLKASGKERTLMLALWLAFWGHPGTSEESFEWIQEHAEEKEHGVAILQRQHRLMGLSDGYSAKLPGYDSDLPDLGDELRELQVEYLTHLRRLRDVEARRPSGTIARIWTKLNRYRDEHNRPYSHEFSSTECVNSRGCCGRSCGCCDKAVPQYHPPDGKKKKKKKKSAEIYGHCTSECLCCIMHNGVYDPDPRLPRTDFG